MEEAPMIVLVNPHDSTALRNKDNIIAFYEVVINQKSQDRVSEFVSPEYIQHNPLIANGSAALGEFFRNVTEQHPSARTVVHRVIAVDDYVFVHVNFLNLFNDDPADTGVAGVDIWRMGTDGRAVEHWDTLQIVGTPTNSAPWIAPNLPPANPNGMF
jgi:predicted SnoaL-like aldol condensation-catalyzing enzyme